MIRYSLRCERGHAFESWFQSSSAYDSQRKRGLVACPSCDSTKVEKAIMAPRIARKGKSKSATEPVTAPTDDTSSTSLVMAPQERELLSKLRELRDHVLKNADDVGNKFPEEARKMHYGDIEQRAIYGEATADEARSLVDEGIDVAALPVLPGDRN
ncbi:MAG: DUF1178 family protein [Afipia sp.]|nr:MAG: DUF1178 family protein [Afipia sp.]